MNPVHKVKWDYQAGARQIARCSGREVGSGSFYWKDVTCMACRRLWEPAPEIHDWRRSPEGRQHQRERRENFLASGRGDAVG